MKIKIKPQIAFVASHFRGKPVPLDRVSVALGVPRVANVPKGSGWSSSGTAVEDLRTAGAAHLGATPLVESGCQRPSRHQMLHRKQPLARTAADMLIGGKRGDAWHQVYRALEHGRAHSACLNKQAMRGFSSAIHDFADTFVALQAARHRADYALEGRNCHRLDALAAIDRAEKAIGLLEQAKIQDRRGFAAHVLFKRRPS